MNDQYQNRFIVAGGLVAVILSLAQLGTVKTFLPWAITIALLSSAFIHYLYPRWRLAVVEQVENAERDYMGQEKHTQTVARLGEDHGEG